MIDDQVKDAGVQACVDYDRCAAEIRRLTAAIGEALGACPLPGETHEHGTHLADAYKPEDAGPEDVRFRSPAEIVALLAQCPSCLRAHELIQERRAVRRSWGSVKRRLRSIARRAATPDPTATADPFVQLELLDGAGGGA